MSEIIATTSPNYITAEVTQDVSITGNIQTGLVIEAIVTNGTETVLRFEDLTPEQLAAFDKFYVHNQISSSALWTINHNLKKYPSVSVVDSAGTQFIGDVTYLNENAVEVRFSAEFSGKAYLN